MQNMSEEKSKKQRKWKSPKLNFLGVSIILASLILGGSIIYAFNSLSNIVAANIPVQETDNGEPTISPEVDKSDHIRGEVSAPVTIVEFSDFQCPFCQRFHLTLTQLLNDYPSQVRWVYKHFPLDSMHPQARPAAEASECAAEQDKFWEFTDTLYENQTRLGSDLYQELASDLGLDIEQFQDCFDSGKYKDKVEADYQEAMELGVRGTPASFINGEPLVGAVPYDSLKSAIDQVLANQ